MDTRGRKVKLLVIDGQRSEADRIERVLDEAGMAFELRISRPSEVGLKELCMEGYRADVVLCPFSLPGTNALKMLNVARTLQCEAPFVLLAYDLSEDIAIELLSVGIEDYITRNTLKRLPVAIRKAIQRHETLTELRLGHARLEASENSVRRMINHIPISVVMLDKGLRLIEASEAWMRYTGHDGEDVLGRHFHELEFSQPEHIKVAQMNALKGHESSCDRECFNYNGKEYWIRWKINPWRDATGEIAGVIMFAEDITDTVVAELERNVLNERLAMAIESAELGLWSWKFGSHTIEFNERGAQIYGFDQMSVPVQDLAIGVHPDDRAKIASAMQSTFYDRSLYDEEYRFIRKDGTEVTVHSMGRSSYDHNDVPLQLYGIVIDRTERAGLEREIREREELFRDMAENITEVFWLTDYHANRVLYMSPQYEKIYGMTVQSIYDDSKSWSQHIHPDDRTWVVERFRDGAAQGTYDVEYRILHPDGHTLWVRDRAFPIRDEQGNVLRIAGISQDITAQKSAQG